MSFLRFGAKVLKLRHTANRSVSLPELGVRGALRLGQTMLAVYPRALRCLVAGRKPKPREVRELFEALGATYIKFGQFIASSPSLFPKEYVDEFQACLDQTRPVPFSQIKDIIESDLGCPVEEVFASIDSEPLASASIAQVYAATLYSGEDVVVKVQKPGVQAIITTDLNTVYLLVRVLELMMPNLEGDEVAGLVEEMYQAMIDECDFQKEADNLIAFDRFLKASANTQVTVPKPHLQASGVRVLTMQRFYGVSLTDESYIRSHRDQCAEAFFNALNTWFSSLTGCEFFHADLHSGNLLLLRDGRVGFIDFGMVGRIKPEVWRAVFDLFNAVTSSDYKGIARAMVIIGITREKVDIGRLSLDIEKVMSGLAELESVGIGGDQDGVSRLMSDLGDVARRYGIRFPRSFTLLLKQFLYFDRYLGLLAPETDMFSDDRVTKFA